MLIDFYFFLRYKIEAVLNLIYYFCFFNFFINNLPRRTTYFVDVILPLSVPNLYSYRVPNEFNEYLKIGQRVIIQFGRKKLYTAIIAKIHQQVPKYQTKYIESKYIYYETFNK